MIDNVKKPQNQNEILGGGGGGALMFSGGPHPRYAFRGRRGLF